MDNTEYPLAFLTKSKTLRMKHPKATSSDGSPRFIINPNAKGTYSMKTLLNSEEEPIYDHKTLKKYLELEKETNNFKALVSECIDLVKTLKLTNSKKINECYDSLKERLDNVKPLFNLTNYNKLAIKNKMFDSLIAFLESPYFQKSKSKIDFFQEIYDQILWKVLRDRDLGITDEEYIVTMDVAKDFHREVTKIIKLKIHGNKI